MTGKTVIVTDARFDDDALLVTALLDEIRVGTGHGAWAAHAVLPGPGGVS
jgi:hypothetical protein